MALPGFDIKRMDFLTDDIGPVKAVIVAVPVRAFAQFKPFLQQNAGLLYG
jgi:hypothetical protein